MNANVVGLRMITNLHCNNTCKFCYQKQKTKDVLDIRTMRMWLKPYPKKHFKYTTIMGGESTLLPNLDEYVLTGAEYGQETRLTTNGTLLTESEVGYWKRCGLDGINISIASLLKYQDLQNKDFDGPTVLQKAERMNKIIPVRINIPLCKENVEGEDQELKSLLAEFSKFQSITICEDILGHYSLLNRFKEFGLTVLEKTNFGLIFLDYMGKKIGYYTHSENAYRETDLVLTPLGKFINWDGYCEAVGLNK